MSIILFGFESVYMDFLKSFNITVIVLLALLSLGVKNIHLGPTLPAFLSPNVAKVLVEQFGIAPNSTMEEDLKLA